MFMRAVEGFTVKFYTQAKILEFFVLPFLFS
jgi:hypothetical protein